MYHNQQLRHEYMRIAEAERTDMEGVTASWFRSIEGATGWYLDIDDRTYVYHDPTALLEDLAKLVDDLGYSVDEHYVVRTYIHEDLRCLDLVWAPEYETDTDSFPEVVHSNQSIVHLSDYGPYDVHYEKREIAGEMYYVYRSHPELGFEECPFIIKSGEGDDIGPRFKSAKHASAFLDGMQWQATGEKPE